MHMLSARAETRMSGKKSEVRDLIKVAFHFHIVLVLHVIVLDLLLKNL